MNPSSSRQETELWYERFWELADRESREEQDLSGLEEFSRRLPAQGKILDAGCGGGWDLATFQRLGFQADGVELSAPLADRARERGFSVQQKNLLFFQPARETYDGIWCNRLLPHFTIEETQRALAIFFQTLKPQSGLLFLTYIEGEGQVRSEPLDGPTRAFHRFSGKAMGSLLRQSGFHVLLHGTPGRHRESLNPAGPPADSRPLRLENWTALLCRRV